MSALLVVSGLLALPVLWAVCIYNRLVRMRNDVKNAWSQVDVQLKRRYDLIPNLVAAVKGFMEHEKAVFQNVAEARSRAMVSENFREKAEAEEQLSGSLKGLLFVMEAYPALRSNENVMQLQEELVSTENRIAFARQLYNDLVANFRTRLEVFPDTIISSLFSFRPYEYFSAGKGDRDLPEISMAGRD